MRRLNGCKRSRAMFEGAAHTWIAFNKHRGGKHFSPDPSKDHRRSH
jgi:hypothetical protein